jgi:protein-S-isoprenylcysteine O-methyltransferase Ste14
MRRTTAVIGSIIFFFIAPFTIAGLVPWWVTKWRSAWGDDVVWLAFVAGGLLAVFGASILIDSFARFALTGLGTPAPVFPTKHLVVSGLYRYVRNPMYVGVVSAIFGQALMFGSLALLVYGAVVWLAFDLFVAGYEEPTLRDTFGAQYDEFCKNVRRWLPRLTPWKPSSQPHHEDSK